MTLKRPLWMQVESGDTEVEYSGLDDREILDAMFPYEGVIGLGSLKVTQRAAGATFGIDIAVGPAVVEGDDVDEQGRYLVKSTAVEQRSTPTAPVSGTRVHRVVAWVQDKLHNVDYTDYEWVIEVLPDIGAGIPAEPDSAITLASISIGAGQTNVEDDDITDLRPFAQTPPSRMLQVGSDAERPGAPRLYDIIQRTDLDGVEELWNGTAWVTSAAGVIRAIRYADATPIVTAGLVDDSDLQVTLPANEFYRVWLCGPYSAHSSADFAWKLVLPASGTLDALACMLPSGSSGAQGDVIYERVIQGTQYVAGGAAANNTTYMMLLVTGMVFSGAGGLAKFQWGQAVTNATGTILRGKTLMMFERVA